MSTNRYTADDVLAFAGSLPAACPEITGEHAMELTIWLIEHLRKGRGIGAAR